MEQSRIEQTLDRPLSVQDQQLFDRVWQRVMAERGGTQPAPAQLVPAQPPATPPVQPAAASDAPDSGGSWLEYAPALLEMAENSFGLWQTYQSLARRVQGSPARHLRTLAADQQQGMRQLSTAYFLLTGEHPSHPLRTSSSSGPMDVLLRELFLREKHWREVYAQRASQSRDDCLSELFAQMSQHCQIHMESIRRILEGM